MLERKTKAKSKGLHIIIVGCGKVGETLVKRLTLENHDVTVIDKNPEIVADLTTQYDIGGTVGNGASFSTLAEANIEQADLLIAVTGSDELNLLCCVVAKRTGHCDVIARVRTPEYSKDAAYLKTQLGLARIINPELETAREISNILALPTALGVSTFARGQVEMVQVKVPKHNMLHSRRIMDIGDALAGPVLICAVERDGNVYIPNGSFVLREHDIVSFISPIREAKTFLKKLGFETNQVKDVLIAGGGKIGYYLAQRLLREGIEVTVIEQDKALCEHLSVLLPKAVIINGDASSVEILQGAGLEKIGGFVAVTGIDEENIMLSLHAKEVSNAKTVTKINRTNFDKVIDTLNLDSVVYPRYITTDALVAYVRAKTATKDSNIETLLHLYDNRAEAIEFIAGEGSDVTGKPLHKLKFKNNLLIACINRGGRVIIPSGNDMILPGDSVITVTTHRGLNDIGDILDRGK